MNVTTSIRVALLLALAVTSACASNRLNEFAYSDRGLAVVSEIPRRPEVLSGPVFLGRLGGDPVRDLLRVGTQVAREVEAHAVRERLDSAATRIDVGYVLEDRTLERAARYLGANPVERDGEEDYLLELVVQEYGIDAEAWESTAYFYIEAQAALIDADSGTEIWRAKIDEDEPIGPRIWGPAHGIRNVVTAATLADLSVEEIVTALESLADYAASEITARLSEDLRKARREGR